MAAECPEPLCQVRVLPAPGCPQRDTSEGVTPPSSLLRAHAPVHPLPAFSALAYTPGLRRLPPAPAGRWTFPTLSPQSLQRRLDPYPAVSLHCSYPFLPEGLRPLRMGNPFGTPSLSCIAASAGPSFRGCSHSFMFSLPCLLGPPTAPTASLSRWAAGPFTPRIDHAVTCHDLWHRYLPESGNWQGGTFTRWIVALSAAPTH